MPAHRLLTITLPHIHDLFMTQFMFPDFDNHVRIKDYLMRIHHMDLTVAPITHSQSTHGGAGKYVGG